MPISIEGRPVNLAGVVPTGSGHLYLVYNSRVLSGDAENDNPFNLGNLVVYNDVPIGSSQDARGASSPADRGARNLTFDGRTDDQVWAVLKQFAAAVNAAGFSYEVPINADVGLNSNAFVNSALSLVGTSLSSNRPGPVGGVVFGYPGDRLFLNFDFAINGGDGNDILDGFAKSQSFKGGAGNDTLSGGVGDDYLEGGTGNDLLRGGGDGDRYSFGLNHGADTISDVGGSGQDVIAFSSGSSFQSINFGWFSRDGNDLVVQARDGANNLALNLRIRDFGSTGGAIERFDLLPGSGLVVSQSWDLQGVWSQLTAPTAPSRPDYTKPDSSPPPTTPSSGSADYNGTSADNIFAGGSSGDLAFGRGGIDALDGNGGNDTLLGGGGRDVLTGDPGNDLLIDDDGGNDLNGDRLEGNGGDDTLVFYGAPRSQTDFGEGGSGKDLVLVDLHDRSHRMELTENGGTIFVAPDNENDEGRIELRGFETVAVLFGSGDDFGHGEGEVDYFEGRGGDDQLIGEAGDDYLDGGSGNDKLDAGTGVDYLDGGSGNDRAELDFSDESRRIEFVADAAASSSGFTFADGTYVEDVENFEIDTGSGDDRLWLGLGADVVRAGSGDDRITTRLEGKDSIEGGPGLDRLTVNYAGSTLLRSTYSASSGEYEVWVGTQLLSATHRLHTVSVEQVAIQGGSGNDVLRDGPGNDELLGRSGDDLLGGGAGDDFLDGGAGKDDVFGGDGNDRIVDESGPNYLRGERGDDEIQGGSDFDDAHGNEGNDTVSGGGGDDWVVGGKDQDHLFGEQGQDLVYGNLGNDTCEGGVGDDILRGGQQDDVLTGGAGNDYLSGDRDSDTMSGGSGADIFHTFGDAGLDRVLDFNRAEGDRVMLDPGTTYTASQVGADTVINMGGGGQMVLVGISMSSLTAGWIFGG